MTLLSFYVINIFFVIKKSSTKLFLVIVTLLMSQSILHLKTKLTSLRIHENLANAFINCLLKTKISSVFNNFKVV